MSRANSKCRAYLQMSYLLAGLLNLRFAQAQTATSPVDFDATCTFTFLGGLPQPDQNAPIVQADIACTGSSLVQIRIAPALGAFQSAFTGRLDSQCQLLSIAIQSHHLERNVAELNSHAYTPCTVLTVHMDSDVTRQEPPERILKMWMHRRS